MPYRYQDPWHSLARQFIQQTSTWPPTKSNYHQWLEKIGNLLGFPRPRSVTIEQLKALESATTDSESTKAVQLSITRSFLVWAGCKAALEWRFSFRIRPKADGIFLDELEVAAVRQHAHAAGTVAELLYSLAVDNGLRTIDMRRLTLTNAFQLSSAKHSTIIGKGRGGGKPGHLELSRRTEKPLADYMVIRSELSKSGLPDTDKLLAHPHRGRLVCPSYKWIEERLDAVSLAAGIHFDPQDLRRTYGHRLHMAGVPLETIAKLMRHESINQSFRCYIGIDSDEMREAQDRLG